MKSMKKIVTNLLYNMRKRLFKPILLKFDQHESMMKALADTNFRTRALVKRTQGKPINVLFVCNEPAEWSMFDSVYKAMAEDPGFAPLVIALPYRHGSLPEGQYKDAGMVEFCETRHIPAIRGYDKETKEWLDPTSLMPDYVFFQSPYDFFPPIWSVKQISMIAQVCYIPYGITIFRGEVNNVVHPAHFFRFTSLYFKENSLSKELFINKFQDQEWFNQNKVTLSGFPKLDYLSEINEISSTIWKRGLQKDIKRILWTPRWRTLEGTCHFFDYKEYFIKFCKQHQEVDFVLRPHPLCWQNFLKTKELTKDDLKNMETEYDNSLNMTLDKTGDYHDTFLTSDILVSDISSMLPEYFATGKPIVYTHRVDVFNELGRELSTGFYWVKNAVELKVALEMLISGSDPLWEKRQELRDSLLFIPEGGSGMRIKEAIGFDFHSEFNEASAIEVGFNA